jgi:hypothetical protein
MLYGPIHPNDAIGLPKKILTDTALRRSIPKAAERILP